MTSGRALTGLAKSSSPGVGGVELFVIVAGLLERIWKKSGFTSVLGPDMTIRSVERNQIMVCGTGRNRECGPVFPFPPMPKRLCTDPKEPPGQRNLPPAPAVCRNRSLSLGRRSFLESFRAVGLLCRSRLAIAALLLLQAANPAGRAIHPGRRHAFLDAEFGTDREPASN